MQQRNPLSVLNSSEKPKPSNTTFIKHAKNPSCPIADVEAFLLEIDRLQLENLRLKETQQVIVPQSPSNDNRKAVQFENQELKSQVELLKNKLDIEQKTHAETVKQLDMSWKQDISTMKYALEQKDLKHKQALRQEQLQYKQEIAKLQTQLSSVSTSENKNQSLVSVLEQELVSLRKGNAILEDKLQSVIQNFDIQSKDQEFTLLKQQAVITSQENHLTDLRQKLQKSKDINEELSNQVRSYKESVENKAVNEMNLKNQLKLIESDFQHLTQTYNEHRDQLQSRIDDLNSHQARQQEQISLLQCQHIKDDDNIKKVQQTLEFEQQNKQNEIGTVQKQKQQLITFLEQELCSAKEQVQQLKLLNQKLDTQVRENQQFWSYNFKELEAKTNALAEECGRLTKLLKCKDDEIQQHKNYNDQIQQKAQNVEKLQKDLQLLDDLLVSRDQEIIILKQQNESLMQDLSRQADNMRYISQQNKTLQKSSEELKLSNITINELQSKCDIMDKEIERLRQKVLEKSQQIEKLQKENSDLLAKFRRTK
ncbi:hypothetical protein pb186bvf_002160 [Paramecium bursaria]